MLLDIILRKLVRRLRLLGCGVSQLFLALTALVVLRFTAQLEDVLLLEFG